MKPPVLLDVNVLIALFDAGHVHHDLAHDWFGGNRHRRWATTTLTENAVLRIVGNPRYGSNFERAAQMLPRLDAFCGATDHQFWPGQVSLRDRTLFDLNVASFAHLTDVYLLGLAKVNGGALATFDRTIPVKAVVGGGPDLLEVVAP